MSRVRPDAELIKLGGCLWRCGRGQRLQNLHLDLLLHLNVFPFQQHDVLFTIRSTQIPVAAHTHTHSEPKLT